MSLLSRRAALTLGAGALVAGCDRLGNSASVRRILFKGEDVHRGLQRLVGDRAALAPEYAAVDMSPVFRSNGTRDPGTADYHALAAANFADYRLRVDGLVARPLALSLAQLRALPARTQITRHDCVEGWSAIGQWHGPLLGSLLHGAGLRQRARYIVFHCADLYGGAPYYESLDLIETFHPQTILALAMNGRPLTVDHGAPLRLRAERLLGYKQAKYVLRIEATDSLARVGGGKGGTWEDMAGYDWFAGI